MDDPIVTSPAPQTIKIEVVNKTPDEGANPIPRKDPGIEYKYNIEYQRFCDDLGINQYDRNDIKLAEKVSLIYDWAKENMGTDDGTKISVGIRDLTKTLGVQNIQGQLLTDHLFRWIRMDMEGEKLRSKEKQGELIEKELQMKQQIKAIEPRISDAELERRIKEGMKDIQKQIKRRVKSHITSSINKGIREAIQKAMI